MDRNSRRQKRQDNVLSALNVAIEGLDLTKEVLSITPAKAVCGSVSFVLTMIRVRFLRVRDDPWELNSHLGFDGKRDGLCRSWAGLRRSLYRPWAGNGREEAGKPQSIRNRCDWAIDNVG